MAFRKIQVIWLTIIFVVTPTLNIWALNREFSTVTVTAAATETVIYTFPVPAGILANSRGIRIVMWGDYINNSGANVTLTIRIRYGAAGVAGTQVVSKTSDNIASAAVTGAFWAEFTMFNTGTTNSQRGALLHQTDRGASGRVTIAGTGTAAVDSTVAQTLSITVTISGAGTTFNKQGAQASYI